MPDTPPPFNSCLRKQEAVKDLFAHCQSNEERYHRIIELGRQMPPLEPAHRIPANLVTGCQSQMFLHASFKEGLVYFEAESDALIAQGLAALLVQVYSGEPPESILGCPPTYLEHLGIANSLSPGRANGLYSLHLRMKQRALEFLTK